MAATKDTGRLLFLDNLRVFLTILVVLHHLACTYGPSGSWYYYERLRHSPASELLLGVLLSANAAYFMGLFFMLSGYFSPRSYDRKGCGAFLRDRLIRLGIPLAIYTLLIAPCLNAALEPLRTGARINMWDVLRYQWFHGSFDTGPMWFVLVLLSFDALYACWRLLRRHHAAGGESKLPGDVGILLFTLGLMTVSFLVRIWFPQDRWITLLGVLHFEPAHLPQYASFFVLGTLAYRGDWFRRLSDRLGRVWLVRAGIALATLVVGMLLTAGNNGGGGSGNGYSPFLGGFSWQSLVYQSYEAFMAVGLSVGLIVMFRQKWNRQGGLLSAMSADTFGVYFLHPPLIVALAFAFRHVNLDPLLKWGLLSCLAVPLCFLVADGLRRLPGVGALLAPPARKAKASA